MEKFIKGFWYGRMQWWEALLFVVVPLEILLRVFGDVVNIESLFRQVKPVHAKELADINWFALPLPVLLITLLMGVTIYQVVGLWRCARNNHGWRGWTWLARLGVVYLLFPSIMVAGVIMMVVSVIFYSGPLGFQVKQSVPVTGEVVQPYRPAGAEQVVSDTTKIYGMLERERAAAAVRDAESSRNMAEIERLKKEMQRELDAYREAVQANSQPSGTVLP